MTRTSKRAIRPGFDDLEGRQLLSSVIPGNETNPSLQVIIPPPSLILSPGQSTYSPNRQFRLTLQTDGNLVEYGPHGDALWASHTNGKPVGEAILQTDGNLVLYDGSGHAVWASHTNGHPGDRLYVQDDGNVVIYQGSTPIWATNTVGADASLYLGPGQSVYSPNGQFRLTLQTDGNLVEYGPNGALWASHTNGKPVGEAILQTDGNLVLYGPANSDGSAHAVWASHTNGHPGATLQVQDDGNVVIYYRGAPIWATNTAVSTPGPISVQDVDFTRYTGGGDIDAWIAQACQAARVPHTDAWVKGLETLCSRESSDDPNAVNTMDPNATGPIVADGHPQNCSRGVAQLIPPNFAAYHAAGTSVAIYDPVANIAAAIRYIRDRYQVSLDGSDLAAKVQQADPSRPPQGY